MMPARKGDWMITRTGRAFWPLDPRAEDIAIEDIAAALSKLCRFGGHSVKFYSVAEHLVHCASKAPAGFGLAALMHDASEAYLSDVIRPIKAHLTNYKTIEAELERVIAEKFGLPWPMPPEVKALDEAIIADEKEQACAPSPPIAWSHWNNDTKPLGVTIQFWKPKRAEREFLRAFHSYGAAIDAMQKPSASAAAALEAQRIAQLPCFGALCR